MSAATLLVRHWYRKSPSGLSRLLWPLSLAYGAVSGLAARGNQARAGRIGQPPVPVVVVGNLVAGGAGKTPVVMALVQLLQQAGLAPGVVSRGYGRRHGGIVEVTLQSAAAAVGDEPLLIHRRTRVPVWVGADRVGAARALCARHPEVKVIVSDDGLQHRQLARAVEVLVFDERGVGNGLMLPAGPLREPFAAAPPAGALVLYNHPAPTTPWPGWTSTREVSRAWPLQQWLAGSTQPGLPLERLAGQSLLAVAGIAAPERFFAMLERHGLHVDRLPLPDHHLFDAAPWPLTTTGVITTEKDAVKLAHLAARPVPIWVVRLDLTLPAGFTHELLARLRAPPPHES